MNGGIVIAIRDALFRGSLQKNASPLWPTPIKELVLRKPEKWVIWGPGKALMLDVLANRYLCEPPLSFRYGSNIQHIEQLRFKGVISATHLSARYEHFKDDFDVNCKQYILDNAAGSRKVNYDVSLTNRKVNEKLYHRVTRELQLESLLNHSAMGLSNGQMRRARLARAVLKEPDLLLVDDAFLGLDPHATAIISQFLENAPMPIILGLRVQDTIPNWCTHICCVDPNSGILFHGPIDDHWEQISKIQDEAETNRKRTLLSADTHIDELISQHPFIRQESKTNRPPSIRMEKLSVRYNGRPVLVDVDWTVEAGSNWHIQGDNGTGKSTILSMITAEHPQSWSSRIWDSGYQRRTGKSNYFDINNRMGMSSPELHALMLKKVGNTLSIREVLSSGFHEGSSNNFTKNWDKLGIDQQQLISKFMNYFGLDKIPEGTKLDQLSVSNQKLALFVKSLVKLPEILILDEAFSAMESEPMARCHEFLKHWPGTMLAVSHVNMETPACEHYLRLLGPGKHLIGDK